ncbi:LysR family transcriptional regulator (plasmid) [Parasedimentitalea marina]|uniref:LysR family transcriptional regulator n=1 Tax=Parasedimentitalea marina TaxID=2483033 RepID=A0A3T0NAD6_9RHOB|nr:LysR substrate-binding domain-containing protein [Parasedimentitalea marina]AZV80986.1 LysR family transcriptional regulator [Parasedimentitalea marina]
MKTGNTSLPPLDYLLAFEAAAETQSFVGASKMLNISETAISRKVRLLELHYGISLFVRGHRSITLSSQGISFLARIQPALQDLRDASRLIVAEHQHNPVTVAATNSVATLWLMPRLNQFTRKNKHLKIMMVASDNDDECLSETVDLAILRGSGHWPGFQAQLLFGETIFPICSPAYLEANPEAADLATFPSHDFLEVSSKHTEWMNWQVWLNTIGSPIADLERSALFNTYPMMVQAAVDGLGIGLGWRHLVDPLIAQGKLVKPIKDQNVRTDQGYYLLRADQAVDFEECQIVENWLLSISENRSRYEGFPTNSPK